MEDWVIALIVILAVLMCGISALVAYLLYRPHARRKNEEKRGFDSDDGVTTKYAEPPENGEVKLAIPNDGDTMLPPYSSKGNWNTSLLLTALFFVKGNQ